MSGTGAFFILLLISSMPVIAVFLWFRLARYPFSLLHFSISLLVGVTSFFPALIFQELFSIAGLLGIFAYAFTEELSRLLLLIILYLLIHRLNLTVLPEANKNESYILAMASAMGLIAGLGFALMESAAYGASVPDNALLRAFTAAPLHGACGFRVGSSVALFRESPGRAFARFLFAVIIHGMYNFMLELPGLLPSIAAIFIVLSALTSAVQGIRGEMKSLSLVD